MIDTYFLNYDKFEFGKVEFDCDYGELIFYKENPKILKINSIYIHPEYRRKGFCKNVLEYIIEKSKGRFKYLIIESVISNILYDYLSRFQYNEKKFKIEYDGFKYKI